MAEKQSVPLMGRLAIQLKMITMDQLTEATRVQGRDPERRLGDIFLELGLVDESQLEKLKKVQRDLVVKHRAKQAMAGRTVPARELPQAREAAPAKTVEEVMQQAGTTETGSAPAAPDPMSAAAPAIDEPSGLELDSPGAPSTPPAASTPDPAPTPSAPAAKPKRKGASIPLDLGDEPSLDLTMPDPSDSDREQLHSVLRDSVVAGASDIHLHSGSPAKLRINGQLQESASTPSDRETVERLVSAALSPEERQILEHRGELDLCYEVDGVGRFRSNVYRQQRGFDMVFRSIPAEPPTLDQLGLPSALAKHTNYHQGMVLITGPAGCGKSSTMAAFVNLINEERDEHILTVEDPIEYIHKSKRCLVNQRHAGRHTTSFARALRGALREDPDIIVIGELRDLETISLAMTAAETGHFVLATLHTANAVRTINRMIGAFPSNQQGQVRTMLSESLRAVISQRLVVAKDGSGRIPALELLVINKAIGNLIRDEKTVQIRSAIQTGAVHGMCLLEQSLNELVMAGKISRDDAIRLAEDKKLITAS